MTDWVIFLIIVVIAVITFFIRSSFIITAGKTDKFLYLQKALRFVPVTVLPALIMPALFYNKGMLDISLGNERLIAGIIALSVAVYKKSVTLILIIGMSALWILKAL